MNEKLDEILKNGLEEIEKCTDLKALDEVRVKFLGKQGELTAILRNMKEIPPEERKNVGMRANTIREKLENALGEKNNKMEEEKLLADMAKEKIDITMPSKGVKKALCIHSQGSTTSLWIFVWKWASRLFKVLKLTLITITLRL